ncbi:MAG: dockerin type I domain-containing protein [Phycisphaerales bacterium]|nr:dockerin type I domain-containing protein [Phycisphaerales bacterium]
MNTVGAAGANLAIAMMAGVVSAGDGQLALMDQIGPNDGSAINTGNILANQIFEPGFAIYDIGCVDDFTSNGELIGYGMEMVLYGYSGYSGIAGIQGLEVNFYNSYEDAGVNLTGYIHDYSPGTPVTDPTWSLPDYDLIEFSASAPWGLPSGTVYASMIPHNEYGTNGQTAVALSTIGNLQCWQCNPAGGFGFGPYQEVAYNCAYRITGLPGPFDCNENGIDDDIDIENDPSIDCDGNGFIDSCEFEWGIADDCNDNGIIDRCDIDSGTSEDCDGYGVPDECEDCNGNGEGDPCDIADGTSADCNGNGIPDECDIADGDDSDCNGNGIPDSCDLDNGDSGDCNGNTIPDECDIADGTATDCNMNGVPDECESQMDCNANGVLDFCDIIDGASPDCNTNNIPDECEVVVIDCNGNNVPDECDIANGTSEDVDDNGVPDECVLPCGLLEQDLGYQSPGDAKSPTGYDLAMAGNIACTMDVDTDLGVTLQFFYRDSEGWKREAERTLGPTTGKMWFPHKSLDISDDTVIASIYNTYQGGRAAIYKRMPGGEWVTETTIADTEESSYFGLSCAISGSVAVVSKSYDSNINGEALVYRRVGTTWLHEATLVQTLGDPSSWFGSEVAVDGNTIIIGSLDNGAWVFEHDGTGWVETQYLESAGVQLGATIDIEGDRAVMGHYHGLPVNYAQVFNRVDGTWVPGQVLQSLDPSTVSLGYSVRLSGDVIAVTSGLNHDTDQPQGKIHIFRFNGEYWNEIAIMERPEFPPSWAPSPRIGLSGLQIAAGFSQDSFLFSEVPIFTVHPAGGPTGLDCNANGICDEMDLASSRSQDCNANSIPDECDIADGTAFDVDLNGIPDLCEADCDNNGWPDHYEIDQGLAPDCNANGVPDSCDIAAGESPDADGDGIPDECETDFIIPVAADGSGLFTEIQPALDLALPGATISVSPGTYQGPVSLPAHPVTLISTSGPLSTVILGDTNASGILITSGQQPDTIIQGFTVTGADVPWNGGGMVITNSSPTIRNCIMLENTANQGGGAYLFHSAPTFEDCQFLLNTALSGGGIATMGLHDTAEATSIINCILTNNVATYGIPDLNLLGGGGLAADETKLIIRDSRLRTNSSQTFGGGFSIRATNATFAGCHFTDNVANPSYGTLGYVVSGETTVQDCVLCGHDFADIVGPWANLGGNFISGDCDGDGTCDVEQILSNPDLDCDADFLLDSCEITNGSELDCNGNGIPDWCDIYVYGTSFDFNGNGVPDECKPDCNDNGIPDYIDIATGNSEDCDGNGIPDECEDCNGNGIGDHCDIADGTSQDIDGDGTPDECEPDCDGDLVPDDYEIEQGWESDCNANTVPDSCDLFDGVSEDCNENGVPDECDIADGVINDCDGDGLDDQCQPGYLDCNGNDIADFCDIADGTSEDCNQNGLPDECDVDNGTLTDCNDDGIADECDPAYADCQPNGIADFCDIADATSADLNQNGVPDECDPDCNENGYPDFIDIAFGTSEDTNNNGIPDECECPDTNGDGAVDVNDLLVIIDAWGDCVPDQGCPADVDGDGTVNVNDVLLVIGEWGLCE